MKNKNRIIGNFLSFALAVFATVIAAIGVFDVIIVSGLTSLLGVLICLFRLEDKERTKSVHHVRFILHSIMGLALIYLYFKWGHIMFQQEEFFITISNSQNMFAWIAIVAIGYLTFRLFGIPMAVVMLLAAGYLLLPEWIWGAGENWIRSAENLWFSTDGVFGRPVEVISRIVLIFIVFGAILQRSGAGEVLLRFSLAATGRLSGGPAFAAVSASALFGSISGTPIANVVSTGTFTIPIIKKVGYKPAFAGGVEAAASTGGQLMPPVMSAVAFLMADLTGISYLSIIVAAAIPALMYYGSLFVVVHLESKKLGIKPIPVTERIKLKKSDWLQILTFVIPLGVIVGVLLTGRTAQNAGFYAMVVSFLLCLVFFPNFRHPKAWLEALVSAGKTSATLMVVVTGIGFVIGVLNMTGVGLMFAEKVLSVASGSLWLALFFVMLACLVMGMGVPIGAAYLMIAIVLGPALSGLGLSLMATHLFIVYFAALSMVTPPVALAAFTAAPIAGADPFRTGWEATRLSIAGFIIPFLFVFHPEILLIVDGFSIVGLIWSIFIFAAATWAIATALSGWESIKLSAWQRVVRLVSAVLFIVPGIPTALIGLCLLLFCFFYNRFYLLPMKES
jgi:TRAP transporter 4TM/12TM fusion protein